MLVVQIFLIIVFLLTIILIIKRPEIKIKNKKISLDYGLVPVLALIVLGIFGILNKEIIRSGIHGSGNIVPWQMVLIFFAVAYGCISLDSTGVFEYFSFKIINFSKNSGKKLFFYLIGFTAILTLFTSNDIVTLTMTPIVLYLAIKTKINPIPYLVGIFFASNIWSMLFYIGSPTNIIIAQGFNLGFLEYAKYMALPTVISGISAMFLTYWLFKNQINRKIKLNKINPREYLHDKIFAIVGLIILFIFFIMLVSSSFIGLEVWRISGVFAICFVIINSVSLFFRKRKIHKYHLNKHRSINHAQGALFKESKWSFVLHRMPWRIFPLILSFFIIISAFNFWGITSLLSSLLNSFTGLFEGIFFTGALSAIITNIFIDQPTSILFVNALQNPIYLIGGKNLLSNGFALVIGTNIGDNLTLLGALAGLMWSRMLNFNHIKMDYKKFILSSLRIIPVILLIALITLFIEMKFIF